MTESTDYLGLNHQKLFEKFRESLPKNIIKTQNVLTVNDDVLYTWDFQDNCVLTLNLKRLKCVENERPNYQILLPTTTTRFPVDLLRVNSKNTLLVVSGSSGILVLELPERCPPHGAFANNKEMVYCRSYSLDEKLLTYNQNIEVRQVRFHPASENNTHILVLTSDNALRLYNIINNSAIAVSVYSVGRRPMGVMPGTKSFFLGILGETGVDFDFGPPELPSPRQNSNPFALDTYKPSNPYNHNASILPNEPLQKKLAKQSNDKVNELQWPIFILTGDGVVYLISIDIRNINVVNVKGPLPVWPYYDNLVINSSCSILCQSSNPPIICIGTITGKIFHSVVLAVEPDDPKLEDIQEEARFAEPPDRALYVFETLELELGYAVTEKLSDYCCPVFLHANESRLGHYFATHEAGVHSINLPALNALQHMVNGSEADDKCLELIVNQPCTADYLLCTKTASSASINPVVGFGVYYNPTSIITLLAQGQVVSSLAISFTLSTDEELQTEDIENFNTPLKKMLSEPFDFHIQRILSQVNSQPILKLAGCGERTPQESYELLQRAAQVFRDEYFEKNKKAIDEIGKRVRVLNMLKKFQMKELSKFTNEKQLLQEKAESLAEKYEDIKEKQENIRKRCERLLILVSQKKSELSEPEKQFLAKLKETQQKLTIYSNKITKLKNQMKYQEVQMESWKNEQNKKEMGVGSIQSQAIRSNLQEMTNQITETIKKVTQYKKQLALN